MYGAIILGIIFGVAVGVATQSLPIGVGVGFVMALAFGGWSRRKGNRE